MHEDRKSAVQRLKAQIRKTPLGRLFDPYGLGKFIVTCPHKGSLLDVGCGNNSPRTIKTMRPDLYYVGLDIIDYNQSDNPRAFADEYLLTTPDGFADAIGQMAGRFDAVLWSHNIEHCAQGDAVLLAILKALKPGGKLYVSFPSEASVSFPHRKGTLNFYDDPTHVRVPSFQSVVDLLQSNHASPTIAIRRYRPPNLFWRGLIVEPVSAVCRRVMRGTWALYGFESVIWARKDL